MRIIVKRALLISFLSGFGIASFPLNVALGQSTADPANGNPPPDYVFRPSSRATISSGKPSHAPLPRTHEFTDAEKEAMRYGLLFSEIAEQEKMAQAEEAAGHTQAANSWHNFLSNQSGLKPEEAEIIKKIGAEYSKKAWALQEKRNETVLSVRKANPGVRMSRFNSPEIAAVEQEIAELFPSTRSELIEALGSKRFTLLDSYTLHSHERSHALNNSNQGLPMATTGAK